MARRDAARLAAARAELTSAAGRTVVPRHDSRRYWAFVALVADLERRGWRLRWEAGPRGRAFVAVEAELAPLWWTGDR